MSATQIESRAGPTFSLNVYCGKKIAKNKKKTAGFIIRIKKYICHNIVLKKTA